MTYSRFLKREVSEDMGLTGFLYHAALHLGRQAASDIKHRGAVASLERAPDLVEKKYDDYRSKIELNSFDGYVLGKLPRDFTVVDGRVQFTDSQRAVAGYLGILLDLVRRYARDGSVVEFGSGGGRNLLYLARNGIQNPLVGLELSGVSVDLARRAADYFGINARFEQCNVTQALPEIGQVDVVFSVHAFEMMPRVFVGGVENIRRLQPRVAIFIEPIEELWPHSPRGLLSRFRVRQLDRLRGFYREAAKLGRVVEAREIEFATNPLNPTVLMVVEMRK